MYEEGNTVLKVQEASESPKNRRQPDSVEPVSRETRINRARATSTNRAFVLYLGVVCAVLLLVCIQYLRMKSELTEQAEVIVELETEYSDLKTENDAYYSDVTASADLDNIKAIAIKRLGMQYPSDDQVLYYSIDHGSSLKQYQKIPSANE